MANLWMTVQKIAAHDYTTFGMCLLQDENGDEVALIEKNHISKGAESVYTGHPPEMADKWCTYSYISTLDRVSQTSELSALAELIANTTGQGMLTDIQ